MKVSQFEGTSEKWDNYVLSYPDTTFYHLISWKNVIEKTFGHKAIYLMCQSNGEITGILPLFHVKSILFGNFMISIPFADYGGACAANQETARLLVEEAIQISKKYNVEYLELRHINRMDISSLHEKCVKQTFILRLDRDPLVIWKRFRDKIRNSIRKAIKSQLDVQIGGKELLKDFYSVFSQRMKELGTPICSRIFFENLLSEFRNDARVFVTRKQDLVIGAAILVCFRKTAEAPWVASLSKFFHLNPNNLIYWQMIKFCCEEGYEIFNFGRSNKDSGHSFFKMKWGAKPIDLHYQYFLNTTDKLPNLSPSNPKYNFALKVWQKLPLFLTKAIGPRIAKYIP